MTHLTRQWRGRLGAALKPLSAVPSWIERLGQDYSRRMLTALLLVYVLDYANRTLIGSIGPTLEHVYHINNAQLGDLAAALAVVSVLATIPLGILTDRIRRTWLFAATLAVWAVATGLDGAAAGIAMFFIVRLFLGVAAATSGPATPSMVGDLVPARDRGRAFGFVSSGVLIGSDVGYVLPIIVLGVASFRWNFWVLAVAGAILAVIFWRLREPERTGIGHLERRLEEAGGRFNREQEEQELGITQGQQIARDRGIEPTPGAVLARNPREMTMWQVTRYVLRVRTDVIVIIARAIGDFFYQGIAIFGVLFATGWYHLAQGEADALILAVGVGALLGVLLVGRISDWFLSRGKLNSRLWLGAIGYIVAPFALFPAFITHTIFIALPLIFVGGFFLAGAGPPLDAVRIDVILPLLRGRAEAIRQVCRIIAEAGAPFLIGLMSVSIAGGGNLGLERTFLILIPFLLLDGLVLLFALKTYQPDVAAAYTSLERAIDREEAKVARERQDAPDSSPPSGTRPRDTHADTEQAAPPAS